MVDLWAYRGDQNLAVSHYFSLNSPYLSEIVSNEDNQVMTNHYWSMKMQFAGFKNLVGIDLQLQPEDIQVMSPWH